MTNEHKFTLTKKEEVFDLPEVHIVFVRAEVASGNYNWTIEDDRNPDSPYFHDTDTVEKGSKYEYILEWAYSNEIAERRTHKMLYFKQGVGVYILHFTYQNGEIFNRSWTKLVTSSADTRVPLSERELERVEAMFQDWMTDQELRWDRDRESDN